MRNSERVLPAVSPTVLTPAGPECNIASSAIAELLRRLALRAVGLPVRRLPFGIL